MKLIDDKIAVLINWPREIDMYQNFLKKLPKEKLQIIANDIKSTETGRDLQNKQLLKILVKKKIKFKLFSNVYQKEKFSIILSTGEASSTQITFISIFKFIFSNTFGRIIEIINLDKILNYFFNRPFTAAFNRNSLGSVWYPEKILAKKTIKYSDGMDLKLNNYPYPELLKNFDIFFTISKFEYSLIKKKQKNKICKIIGYSRFHNILNKKKIFSNLKKEFKLNSKKKTILWMPTHIDNDEEANININSWLEKIRILNKEFNLIVRPHPFSLTYDSQLIKKIKRYKLNVDTSQSRQIGEILKISDIIICDYGGSVFNALYFEKPIVLLNMPQNSSYVNDLIKDNSLDISLRKKLINLDFNVSKYDIMNKVRMSLNRKYLNKIISLKYKYFEKDENKNNHKIRKYLLNILSENKWKNI